MLCSKILRPTSNRTRFNIAVDEGFDKLKTRYREVLARALLKPSITAAAFGGLVVAALGLFIVIPSEYAPREDRGIFFVIVNGPEGASFNYINEYMTEIEGRLMPLVESGEVNRLLVRAPRSFGNLSSFNTGVAVIVLADWSERRSAWAIMDDVRARVADLPGVT